MDAFMAFVSIVAIIAIVVVAGGLIAFIAHMIIGAFDNERRDTVSPKEVIDYTEYKQLESSNEKSNEFSSYLDEVDKSKVEEEKIAAEKIEKDAFDLDEDKDESVTEEEIAELENSLKAETIANEIDEDMDLDDILSAISEEVIEEEKEIIDTEDAPKMSDELASMSIDEYLNQMNNSTEETPITEGVEVEESDEEDDFDFLADVKSEEIVSDDAKIDEPKVEETIIETKEDVKVKDDSQDEEIARLKAELADLNQKLADATNNKVEIVTINATEEECVARLEMLEERLKEVKKDYKINMKEYRPLKKVMNEYQKNLTKLRRKDAMVAKKKVALYGVNNYVDIDKEKAEKLSNELELLNGLRLSVSHCEEVINANKDRYPILEHTNKILEDQIAHIEADIATTQATLKKIREDNGEGSEENN